MTRCCYFASGIEFS